MFAQIGDDLIMNIADDDIVRFPFASRVKQICVILPVSFWSFVQRDQVQLLVNLFVEDVHIPGKINILLFKLLNSNIRFPTAAMLLIYKHRQQV